MREPKGLANHQMGMTAKTNAPAVLLTVASLIAACGGPPAASPSAVATPKASPSATSVPPPTSLLPDGVWEVTLTAADLVAAGAPADAVAAGTYRWTFDGTRARLQVAYDGGGSDECDADASTVPQGVRLRYHIDGPCGKEVDVLTWSAAADRLHLSLVTTTAPVDMNRAYLEAKPWKPVSGDATLSWSDAWVTCPDPEGGACLDTAAVGTHTTDAFIPGLTYTMPDGWRNLTDQKGEVFFLPPGQDVALIVPGGADYIGVYTSVRAENRNCSTEEEAASDEPGVGRTPEALAAEFQARPGLATTTPTAVTIGGLSGLVMDLRLAPGWTGHCFYAPDPAVQLLGGVDPSAFEHGILTGLTMRLYLLARGEESLAIEIDDYADGANLDAYSAIVEQFVFGG
jgi:hypothetical protein